MAILWFRPMATSVLCAFWWFVGAAHLLLVVLMIRRGLRRTFPTFFTYVLFQVVGFLAEILSRQLSYSAYFYVYWAAGVIGVGLGFAVIQEIFSNVFRPYDSLRELGGILFKWAALVLVLVAVVSAAGGAQGAGPRLIQTILVLDRSVRVMQCGLVLFLFLFSGYLALSHRAHVFGIALGFGIFAAVDLLLMTLRVAFPGFAAVPMSLLKSGASCLACGMWIWYLSSPEPRRVVVDQRARSQEWNFALGALSTSEESFLPMIENAVERVLQRRESGVHNS